MAVAAPTVASVLRVLFVPGETALKPAKGPQVCSGNAKMVQHRLQK